MAWIILIISGILEAVWATALGKSDGFTKLIPSVIFFIALIMSMIGLAYAMRTLPVGVAYAVWVGIGATLTILYAVLSGAEAVSFLKIIFLIGIIGCIVGLKLLHK